MASTLDSNLTQTAINFADPPRRGGAHDNYEHYGVWSCKFSADGNEVIAGGTEMVFGEILYPVETMYEAHASQSTT